MVGILQRKGSFNSLLQISLAQTFILMEMLEEFLLGKGEKHTHSIWSVSEKKGGSKNKKWSTLKPKVVRKISSRK